MNMRVSVRIHVSPPSPLSLNFGSKSAEMTAIRGVFTFTRNQRLGQDRDFCRAVSKPLSRVFSQFRVVFPTYCTTAQGGGASAYEIFCFASGWREQRWDCQE
jgi:hypothetical protein